MRIFDKNLIRLFLGNSSSEIIQFIASPLIARLYNPLEFAFFVFCMSITEVSLSFVTLKFEIGITKFANEKKKYLKSSILSSLIVTFLIISPLYLLEKLIDFKGTTITDTGYLISIFFLINCYNIYRSIELFTIAESNYSMVSKAKILNKSLIQFFQIALNFVGSIGLILGRLMGLSAGIVYLFKKNKFKLSTTLVDFKTNLFNIHQLLDARKNMHKYLILSSLTRQLNYNSTKITIPFFYDISTLGLYGWAYNYTIAPLNSISSSISDTLFQELAKRFDKKIFLKSILYQFLIGIPFFTILYFFGETIFSLLFGSNWKMAGRYSEILSPYLFFVFVNSPLVSIYYIMNIENKLFTYDLFNFISLALVFIITSIITQSFEKSLFYFSVVGVVNNLWLSFQMIKKALQYEKTQ